MFSPYRLQTVTGQMRVTMDIPRQATTTTHRPPPADPSVSTAPTSTTNNNTTATTAAAAASDAKLSRRLDQLRRSVASQHGGLFPHAVRSSSHHNVPLPLNTAGCSPMLCCPHTISSLSQTVLCVISAKPTTLPQLGEMVTTAVIGVSPLRTLLGLRTALRCRATSPLSSSCIVFPNASLRTVAAAPVSALRPDSSGPTSLTSQLNLKPRNYHDHPNSSKMGGILSSNRKKDLLLPFAGPSPPGSSSGDNPKADNQTSGPDLSAEEKRRQKLRDNMFKDGELGKRGEEYVAIQMLLFAGIAFPPDFLFSSFLPLAFFEPSDVWYLNYVVGAALLGIGGWFSSNAVKDLGTNLSPFPKPPTDSELETGGTTGDFDGFAADFVRQEGSSGRRIPD
ncbi:unnamed protein product [Closterium sp. NIES-53]